MLEDFRASFLTIPSLWAEIYEKRCGWKKHVLYIFQDDTAWIFVIFSPCVPFLSWNSLPCTCQWSKCPQLSPSLSDTILACCQMSILRCGHRMATWVALSYYDGKYWWGGAAVPQKKWNSSADRHESKAGSSSSLFRSSLTVLVSFFHIFPCLWSDLLTSSETSIPPLGKVSTQYETKSVFWRWEKHLSVFTGNNTFPQLLHLLLEQLQDNTLLACVIFSESIQGRCLVNKMFSIYWSDVLIGCQGSLVLEQQILYYFISSSRPSSSQHLCCVLLGSECKAITHWRVCLNHTEWLWILNVGLRPSEKQAHGGDSLSSLLIWFFFLNSFGNKLLTRRSPSFAFGSSAAPSNQTTAGTNILLEWKRSTLMNILFSIGKKNNLLIKTGLSGWSALPKLINRIITFNVPFISKTCSQTIRHIKPYFP